MKKARCWIVLVFMILGLVDLDSFVFADVNPMEKYFRPSLAGLQGMCVVIEYLQPEIRRDGLTEQQLRTDTELKLRMAGIKVLSPEESHSTPGVPALIVNANILKTKFKPLYIFNVTVVFAQYVFLVRKPDVRVFACTWDSAWVGYTNKLEDIRAYVKDRVDEFINAYLSVNPK
ncbi:MAG: hypothetical protein ACFFCW_21170 [Candidatus Hodarchaeota archaeon]